MSTGNETVRLVISGDALRVPHVGVGVYAQRLIRALARHPAAPEFRVAIEEEMRPVLADLPDRLFVTIPSRPSWPHPLLRQMAFGQRLASTMRRDFPQAILHSPGPMWCWRPPARFIVTIHDCIYRHFPLYLGRFVLRRWLALATERVAARASRVLTVSEFSADDLARLTGIPRERIRVLYNWVGPEFTEFDRLGEAARVRAKYHLPSRFWLYLGGYDYRKNVERLVDAYALARRDASCPPLVLAGAIPAQTQPPYSDPMGRVRGAGLGAPDVLFPGSIATEDLPGLYAAAELLVYPSLYEGFGLPPAEAMAVGTPALVSDTSSLPEVVTRAECRFDPHSVESIAGRLREASIDRGQFRSPLRPEFTESFAITRYLALFDESGFASACGEI